MAFTKVRGPGINTTDNYQVGVITATKFVGPLEAGSGSSGTFDSLTVSGNISVGGTLTYEDVTNVDSLGIITARKGISVSGGGTLDQINVTGISTFSSTTNITGELRANGNVKISNVGPKITLVDTNNDDDFEIKNNDGAFTIRDATNSIDRLVVTSAGELQAQRDYLAVGINTFAKFNRAGGGGPELEIGYNAVTLDYGYFGTGSAHGLGLRTNDTTALFIDTNQKVGIGTNNPATKTVIAGSDSGDVYLQISNSTTGYDANSGFLVGLKSDEGATLYQMENNYMRFGTNGTERLRIASTGKVLIGDGATYSANGLLHIVGDDNSNGPELYLQVNNNNTTDNIGALWFGNNVDKSLVKLAGHTHTANNTADFTVSTSSGGTLAERLRIDSDGNVFLKDSAGQGNSLVNYIRATDSSGNSQYTLGMLSTGNEDLYLAQHRNAKLRFQTNGSSRWIIDGDPGHLTPAAANTVDIGSTSAEIRHLYLGDSGNIKLGSDQDAEIYHNGGSGFYLNNSTGNTYIRSGGGQILMRPSNSYDAIVAKTNEVELYYNSQNHSTPKLTTSATGITVDGEVAASLDYPNYQPALDFNFARVKKLDPRIRYYRTGPASYVDEFGIVKVVGANTPRFDHDPGTKECKGLLIEDSRTNQITNSYNIDGTGWDPVNLDRTPFTTETLAPNGKYEATKIIPTTASNQHYTNYGSITKASGAERQCVSFWAKLSSSNYPILKSYITGAGAFTNYSQQNFNLSTGVVASTGSGSFTNHSAKMTKYPNGWWKCEYEATLDSSETTKRLQLLANDGSSGAGNGTDGYYIWGVQVEVGDFATSHIPTSGNAATRGHEQVVIDGEDFTNFYNTSESTVLAVGTMKAPATSSGQYNIFHIGNDNNDGHGVFREYGGKDVWYHMRSGSSTPSGGNLNPSAFGDWDQDEEARIAIAFKSGDQAISVNGGNQITATVSSGYPSANISKMWIGSAAAGGSGQFSGHIKRIAYYPKQLSDSQLNTLTA